MSNFLEEVENEFSRGRGRSSRLSPLDWNLAANWETRGVPLSLVLRAMGDVFKQNAVKHKPETINSLRYFTPAVEKTFAEWQSSQVGKSTGDELRNFRKVVTKTKENIMPNSQSLSNENARILDYIIERLPKANLPEPLQPAVRVLRGELLHLLDDVNQKSMSLTEIENRLAELARQLEIPLAVSISENEREQMIEDIKRDYDPLKVTDQLRQKILSKQLYKRFDLPELTLFEI